MYKRDLAVVLLSLFAIWWSLQSEGTYHFYKSFYYDLPPDKRLVEEQHPLPAPIVVRLWVCVLRARLARARATAMLNLRPSSAFIAVRPTLSWRLTGLQAPCLHASIGCTRR